MVESSPKTATEAPEKESCLFTFREKKKLVLTPFVVDVTKHTWAFLAYARLFSACLVAGPAKGSHELMVSSGCSTPPVELCSPLSPAGSSGISKGSQRFFKQPGEVSWDSKAPHPLLRAGFGS